MSVDLALALLATAVLGAAVFGIVRYRTPINPLTIFAVVPVGLFTLFSGVVTYALFADLHVSEALRSTALISILYLLAAIVPFCFRGRRPAQLFGFGLRLLSLSSTTIASRFKPTKLILLLLGAGFALVLLAVAGGGGLLWLTDPRSAYLRHRAGAGPFWLVGMWLLVFSWLYYLWARRPKTLETVLVMLVFTLLAYFTGSKNAVLILGVVAVVYYNFYVRKLGPLAFLGLGGAGFAAALALLVIQGAYTDMLLAVAYFDYFGTTAYFIARFSEFGYHFGTGWLSSLWFFVPRGLYPDKPYEYGVSLIHAVLYPGAAEAGHTAGVLPWTLSYLDFGVFGVMGLGLVHGFWQRMVYEYFLEHRDSFFAFVFMLQITVWPVMAYAPLVLFVVWLLLLSLFLRLVLRGNEVPLKVVPGVA